MNFPQWDTDLFLWLNDKHSPILDPVMYWVSDKFIWIPLYLFFIYLMYRRLGKRFWIPFLFLVLGVGLADFISSGVLKQSIQRLRPSHTPALEGLIHHVNNYKGGLYSFTSSHSANMFAVATFMSSFLNKRYARIALFLWAALIAYSRIYLGVHYPLDIICGGLVGFSVGSLAFYVYKRVLDRKNITAV